MARLLKLLGPIGKFVPLLGWIVNRIRYPRLHCGIQVEIAGEGTLSHGDGVRVGAFTRIYLEPGGSLWLGDRVGLGRDVHVQTSLPIRIGSGSGISDRARIYGAVDIGRSCLIGANLNVASGQHVFRSPEPWLLVVEQEHAHPLPDRPVSIGDDVWIGINVVINPGITVGRGAVIGANAVVTRDVAPYQVVGGIPARPIGERMAFLPPRAIDAGKPADRPYFYAGFDGTAGNNGLACDARFALALATAGMPDADIQITLASPTGGFLQHGAQRQPFPAGETTLRFAPEDAAGWLHRFALEGTATIRAATVLGRTARA